MENPKKENKIVKKTNNLFVQKLQPQKTAKKTTKILNYMGLSAGQCN